MTNYPQRRCKKPTCRRMFDVTALDLIFCPICREQILAAERAAGRTYQEGAFREMEWYASQHNKERNQWDTRIIDETGKEVWALDLAKRYLSETRPRPV